MTPDRYIEIRNQLRIALENRAQEVLLRYLAGDQNPQTQQDFEQGARYMEAARTLTRNRCFSKAARISSQGRALLFDKKFAGRRGPDRTIRAHRSRRGVRLQRAGHRVSGTGPVRQSDSGVSRCVPPRAALVLSAAQRSAGAHRNRRISAAIRLYQQAMRLTPQYSYLPYNLGLVYQRLNRRKDARGVVSQGDRAVARCGGSLQRSGDAEGVGGQVGGGREAVSRRACTRKPDSLPARHNLALLLAADKNRQAEAIQLWRANLPYLPSKLSLAETLAESGDRAGAIEQYRQILDLQPGYIAARVALAELLDPDGALEQLRIVVAADPQDVPALEQIGDIESARGHTVEARAAYTQALAAATERASKKRISKKLNP